MSNDLTDKEKLREEWVEHNKYLIYNAEQIRWGDYTLCFTSMVIGLTHGFEAGYLAARSEHRPVEISMVTNDLNSEE
jgi:hypothetical protein